jgi:hypothetical protein
MDTNVSPMIATSYRAARAQLKLEVIGVPISRWELVPVWFLIWFLKVTPAQAAGTQLLIAHSPLMS